MQLLAEGLRGRKIHATAAAVNQDFRNFQCDVHLAKHASAKKNFLPRLLFATFAMTHYDVFHFFWGVSLLGLWRFHLLDLPLLRLLGKRVVVHFRGLDVVDMDTFDAARAHWAAGGSEAWVGPKLTTRPDQKRKLAKWRRFADTLLISEPDLWDVVPEAKLSPQVIDVSHWRRRSKRGRRDEVVVVHAPTSRRKKGTEFVVEACHVLRGRGLPVRLELVENVPYQAVREIYEQADVAVDQLLYGWHGKFSVETMAMGLPTVCFLRQDLVRLRPDIPIVSAHPGTLTEVLERLVRDEAWRRKLSAEGLAYVQRYHSLEVVLNDLLKIYGLTGSEAS